MSRQIRALIVGVVLVVLLGVATFGLRVPYVVLSPGPTFNTLGSEDGVEVITVKGHPVAHTDGKLNLTTVAVDTQNTTVAGAIKGWLRSDQVVVPHDSVYPPGQTQQQTNEQDQQDFLQSQNSAVAAASCQLGYPRGLGIAAVQSDSPNAKVLHAGDSFVSLAGTAIGNDKELAAVLGKHKSGQTLTAVLVRSGKQVTEQVRLAEPAKAGGPPRLGIGVTEGCIPPFQIDLALTGVGGPSAGLMFALGIVDTLGSDNLTHGRVIAGTGTIDASGNVGQIGGIALKMRGAKRDGAAVFLAPASNCSDVRGNIPSGLTVIKVSTLSGAIDSLDQFNAGNTNVPRC